MVPEGAGTADLRSVLTSEAFYLNCFKILPCSKRYSHEWTTCPFAHPGEKAKRRDPQCYNYDCEMCPAIVKGEVCKLGLACPHSHHVFESFLHPNKFRTMLCKDGDACHREVCFFAHGAEQLRVPSQENPHMPSLGVPSRLRGSSSGPGYQQPQHRQQLQQHSSAAVHARHGLQSPPASSPQAAWQDQQQQQQQQHQQQQQQQQSPAGARPVVHFSSINTVLGPRPEAAMGSPVMAYTACESTGSLASLPAVLPLGSGDWHILQQAGPPAAARTPAERPAAAADGGLPEMYSLLNSLVEEVQARRQEAAQSKNAEEAAKEQLRLVMSALATGSSTAPSASDFGQASSAMAASGPMPRLVLQEAGPPGLDAASMMQLPLPGPLCRNGSAGSSNWGHMSGLSALAGSRNSGGFAVHELRSQQQQPAAFSSASGSTSSVSTAGVVCSWVPAPDGGSNHSTADNMLSWLGSEGCDNSGTVLLPAAMCAVPAPAGGCSPQTGMLQHASGALAGNALGGAGICCSARHWGCQCHVRGCRQQAWCLW